MVLISVKKENQEKVLKNIKLFVKDPNGKILRELYLINRRGKFALRVKKKGLIPFGLDIIKNGLSQIYLKMYY